MKKEFWFLLASFVLPILLGTVFFFMNPGYFSQNTVNYGTLINPIITTSKSDFVFDEKKPGDIHGIWTLAYKTKNCDLSCDKALKAIDTARILMQEDLKRLQLAVITESTNGIPEGILKARVSEAIESKLSQFSKGSIFLIDPIGNIMLHYQAENIDVKKVVKDLERLFKYSRVG